MLNGQWKQQIKKGENKSSGRTQKSNCSADFAGHFPQGRSEMISSNSRSQTQTKLISASRQCGTWDAHTIKWTAGSQRIGKLDYHTSDSWAPKARPESRVTAPVRTSETVLSRAGGDAKHLPVHYRLITGHTLAVHGYIRSQEDDYESRRVKRRMYEVKGEDPRHLV